MTTPLNESLVGPRLPPKSQYETLMSQLDTLSAHVWDNAICRADIERWLDNFDGSELPLDSERLNALHIIANFNLFGLDEIRELLRSIYRDLFRYPIIQNIRRENVNTLDSDLVNEAWNDELIATRFLGMGNPSESGAHLLYYFRQVNGLGRDNFVHQHQVLDGPVGNPASRLADKSVKRLVFIDDVLGSGQQAVEYSGKFVADVKKAAATDGISLNVAYFVLFAKEEGLTRARGTEFDTVEAVHEIQESELAFSDNSRVYVVEDEPIGKESGRRLASHYGDLLYPGHPLGYRNGQLLLGFRHNVPDNTLPIVWSSEEIANWVPAFPRYGKI
jgi:hypothetical protein